MSARILYVQAITPIRVGTGQGAGVIDLPVIREKVTGWPYLPGSSIKGVLRDAVREENDRNLNELTLVFGPKTDNAHERPGGLIFADLKLLALPVRTYKGGFAWVTSPLAIARWQRDHASNGLDAPHATPLDVEPAASEIFLTASTQIDIDGKVWLEDLRLDSPGSTATDDEGRQRAQAAGVAATAVAKAIAEAAIDPDWRPFFKARFGIVSDTTFGFLTQTATEVTARNRIDEEKKVVADGALWWEEAAPAETIFAGPLTATEFGIQKAQGTGSRDDGIANLFSIIRKGTDKTLQIGANATVGRGLARAVLVPSAPEGGQS